MFSKKECLVLLLPHVIQQETPMEDIEALIGINQLKKMEIFII